MAFIQLFHPVFNPKGPKDKNLWAQIKLILEKKETTDELKALSLLDLVNQLDELYKRVEVADLLYSYSLMDSLPADLHDELVVFVFEIYSQNAFQNDSVTHQIQLQRLIRTLKRRPKFEQKINRLNRLFLNHRYRIVGKPQRFSRR